VIEIIGILDDGPGSLTLKVLRIVEAAQVLVGGSRHLTFFPDHPAEKWPIKGSLSDLAARIGAEERRVVVLASGDPNFYGIASFLANRLGRDRIRIHPNVSAMALAFARAKIPWDGATLTSVHGRSMDGLAELIRSSAKIGLFTDGTNSPAAIGRLMAEAGVTGYTAYVCENLGGDRERVVEIDIVGLAASQWASLNVLILVRGEEV
jgi:precorrin-6Y C5,15-methyltransferase (decarboxylating)